MTKLRAWENAQVLVNFYYFPQNNILTSGKACSQIDKIILFWSVAKIVFIF